MKQDIEIKMSLSEADIATLISGLEDYAQECYDDAAVSEGALFEKLRDLIDEAQNHPPNSKPRPTRQQ